MTTPLNIRRYPTWAMLGALLFAAPPLAAASHTDTAAALRRELEALRSEYREKLAELEERIRRLESGEAAPAETPAAELDQLRAAARAAAEAQPALADPETTAPAVGRERNLNRLNPEISATGVLLATNTSGSREEFNLEATEIDIQSALDPFSRTRWVIGFSEEGVEIEEGYVTYSSLPGGLELIAGKFKQRFGALNRQHLHALPQTDYPLVYQTIFGEEGLAQTGISFTWLLPKPWASANEITLELTNSENETAFSGEDFEDLAALLKLKNFWETGPATYLEWGLSGIVGTTPQGGDSQVFGTDVTWQWRPPSRAKYRELIWRTEFILSRRDDPLGISREAQGGYSYVEGLLRRGLYAGLRYDRAEDPLFPAASSWQLVPYLTWWQSEYVRLRGEFRYLHDEVTDDSDRRFALQLTWAAGPHKHETY